MAGIDDAARKWTDGELEALERRIHREYYQAEQEMRGKQAKWLEKFEREREMREKALDNTKEAMEAHERWLQSQAAHGDWMRSMVDGLSESAHKANVRAADMVNGHVPRIFAENANRAAYAVDSFIGHDTGFTLVNEDAVRYLMGIRTEGADPTQVIRETVWFQPQEGREGLQDVRRRLSEMRGRKVDYAKDIRWNRQKFTSAITQGIIQGESIPQITKRTEEIFGQNRSAAVRAARTATTAAENAGRMSSFERAKRLGIDMEIQWLATLDSSTRSSHRALDGQTVKLGESFESEHGPIDYPGDPAADPAETYNCRCRANGRVVGFDGKRGEWADEAMGERWARLPEGMTYDEWKTAGPLSRAERYQYEAARVSSDWYAGQAADTAAAAIGSAFNVAEGANILGTWQRRPDEFAFEIEDVMAAQGFDGKPRVVSADEFDAAVRQANGGDGLIMQRTYSAPDEATLEAYRDQLYSGKWYVDCSTGGAQYGQGMYAAADYTGVLSDGIKEEMSHYIDLNVGRGAEHSYIETMTLDSSAKIVEYDELASSWAKSTTRDGSSRAWMDEWMTSRGEPIVTDEEYEYIMRRAGMRPEIPKDTRNKMDSAFRRALDDDFRDDDITAMYSSYRREKGSLTEDIGAFAVKHGYDAINASGHGASGSYTVILNRTKLIIKEP